MQFRKIVGPIRIDSPSGAVQAYRLAAKSGGRMCKVTSHAIKVLVSSDTTNLRVGIDLEHGRRRRRVRAPLDADQLRQPGRDAALRADW
jgi:hypothetical protein